MFKGNRGMVLRTLAAGFALVGANETKTNVPKGTRVKFMSDIGDGKIRVKVKDSELAKNLQGAHMEISAKNVTRVERGRPEGEEGSTRKNAAKKPAGKKAAKKSAAKKGGAKKASGGGRKRTAKPAAAPASDTSSAGADDELDLSVLEEE